MLAPLCLSTLRPLNDFQQRRYRLYRRVASHRCIYQIPPTFKTFDAPKIGTAERGNADRTHRIVLVRGAALPRCGKPALMFCGDVLCHDCGRNDEISKTFGRSIFRNACQDPEKIRSEHSLCLQSDATGPFLWIEGFHLNMREPRPRAVAAKNVGIGRVAQRHNRRIATPAQLTCNEKLTRIAAMRLIPFASHCFPWPPLRSLLRAHRTALVRILSLLLFGHVMPHRAPNDCPGNRMMPCYMTSYSTNGRPLEATGRLRLASYNAQNRHYYKNRFLHSLLPEVTSCLSRSARVVGVHQLRATDGREFSLPSVALTRCRPSINIIDADMHPMPFVGLQVPTTTCLSANHLGQTKQL
ncbi:hypothetical protein PSP6_690101 [Paraburkholderia tropica]|nr:hypothetical protein PSP6_690101 [Paraburkholderia tropica]